METKISVIMPVYNTEEFLAECLDSIFAQTLQEFEIICVDDGSTDGSLAILNAYAEKDPRVKVLTQQNQYAGVARNHGMRHATGKYLLFLDSDDFFSPEMLEKTYTQCERDNADICAYLAITYNNETKETEGEPRGIQFKDLPENRPFNAHDIPDRVFSALSDVVSNKLFRREFVEAEKLQFLPLSCTNDQYFSYVSLACAERLTVLDEVFYYHRLNQEGNTRTRRHLEPLSFFASWKEVAKTLKEKGRYQPLEKGLLDMLLRSSVARLNFFIRTKSEDAYLTTYETVQKEVLPILSVEDNPDFYYRDLSKLRSARNIENSTAIEYLLIRIEEEKAVQAKDLAYRQEQRKKWAAFKERHEALKNRYAELKGKHAAFRERYAELRNKQNALRERYADLKNKYAALREKNAELREKNKELRGNQAELKKKNAALRENQTKLKADLRKQRRKANRAAAAQRPIRYRLSRILGAPFRFAKRTYRRIRRKLASR